MVVQPQVGKNSCQTIGYQFLVEEPPHLGRCELVHTINYLGKLSNRLLKQVGMVVILPGGPSGVVGFYSYLL